MMLLSRSYPEPAKRATDSQVKLTAAVSKRTVEGVASSVVSRADDIGSVRQVENRAAFYTERVEGL